MKVSADRETFPDFEKMDDVITVASDLRASDGTIIGGADVVAFDTETGQVWKSVRGPKGETLAVFRHRETKELYTENGRPYVYSPYGPKPRNDKVLDKNGDWMRGVLYKELYYPAPLEIIPYVPTPDEQPVVIKIAE